MLARLFGLFRLLNDGSPGACRKPNGDRRLLELGAALEASLATVRVAHVTTLYFDVAGSYASTPRFLGLGCALSVDLSKLGWPQGLG